MLLARNERLARAEQDGRYLHWDELRRRPKPDGASHEDWWQLIKLARSSRLTKLPLTDESGHPFGFVLTDSIQRIGFGLEHELRGVGQLPEALRDPGMRKRYELSSLIEEALRSSQLEGASTTRDVAKDMIRSRREPRNEGERMVLSNYRAIQWVREHFEAPLTPGSVLELHSIMMQDILDAESGGGRLRRGDEPIAVVDHSSNEIVHTPPKAALLSARMTAMCRFANGTVGDDPFIPPIVRAILLHFWLAYDHPFVDGNGRAARALFYWAMAHQGYKLAEFASISRAIKAARSQYEKAFVFSETDGNDATYFLINQMKMIRNALDDLYEYVGDKEKEITGIAAVARRDAGLNDRQLAVISYALRHPQAEFTVEAHRMSHGVAYETARTDLEGLVANGFLDRARSGKKLYFYAVRDLDKRFNS